MNDFRAQERMIASLKEYQKTQERAEVNIRSAEGRVKEIEEEKDRGY